MASRLSPNLPASRPPVVRLGPEASRPLLDLRELWSYRELLAVLALRDLRVRYKQTLLGAAWAILQPLGAVAVMAVFLGRLAGVPSDGLPYPLFALAGFVPWQLFAGTLTQCTRSVVENERLVTKVYFPRLLLPLSATVTALVDFAATCLVLVGAMVAYRVEPSTRLLAVPAFVALAVLTALAFGVWLAALTVQYRDVRHTVGFLLQLWLFATPVVYPASLLPPDWRPLYAMNPMVGAIDGFRWALLGSAAPSTEVLATSTAAMLLFLVGGLAYFRRAERVFADVL